MYCFKIFIPPLPPPWLNIQLISNTYPQNPQQSGIIEPLFSPYQTKPSLPLPRKQKTGPKALPYSLVILSFIWTLRGFWRIDKNSAKGIKKAPLPASEREAWKFALYPRLGRRSERNGDDSLYDIHKAVFLPLTPTPPCRDVTAHFRRELIPAATSGKHIDNGFQRLPGIGGRTPTTRRFCKIGLELAPLCCGDLVRHGDFLG